MEIEKLDITSFTEKYCQDIIKDTDIYDIMNEDKFTYDIKRKDPDTGEEIKYIIDEKGVEIDVMDIIEMERSDFENYYRTPESLAMYDQYISNFKIDYGEDVLLALRNQILKQNDRINKFKKLREDIDCGL